ncbi:MAG: hypothetical protein JRN15_10985 [Nitrososphaerota archaeon]|nr:hypothetical protein [Nitrososphaerota archaeon]
MMNFRLTISLSPDAFDYLEKTTAPGASFESKSAFIDYLIKRERDANASRDAAASVDASKSLTPREEIRKNLADAVSIQEKLGKKLDAIRILVKKEMKLKEMTEGDISRVSDWLWSYVTKNNGTVVNDKGKRFVISGENIEDYRKLGTIYFRNQQLEKMMSKDTAMIAEAKTSKIFAAVSALVQEGKLGEDFANIDESDPRAKDILENFRQLMEMLEKTEGTPEQARVEEKIKVLMDSKVYKNAKSLADTMLPTTESTPSKNAP